MTRLDSALALLAAAAGPRLGSLLIVRSGIGLHAAAHGIYLERSRRSNSAAPSAARAIATAVTPQKVSGSIPSSIALP